MTSGGSTRRRPRPWLCPASVCVVGTLLQLREAASLVSPCTCTGAAAARRVSSSSTSSSWLSSCTLQHGSTGPLLAERIRVRRRSRCTGVGRLLRCSGLTAVEEGPAAPGSDEVSRTRITALCTSGDSYRMYISYVHTNIPCTSVDQTSHERTKKNPPPTTTTLPSICTMCQLRRPCSPKQPDT